MSDHVTEDTILLVGAGPIAVEYAKVLTALHVPYIVVGRGSDLGRNIPEKNRD